MEPFRDDREAAARRIEQLEAENRALKQDLFVQKAPPPVVLGKPGIAPGVIALVIAIPAMLLVLGAAGAVFFMVAAPSAPPVAAVEPAPEVVAEPPAVVEPPVVAIPTPEAPPSAQAVPVECTLAETYKGKNEALYAKFSQACASKRAGR